MKNKKTSEARLEAQRRYRAKHPEKASYHRNKSVAKTFLRHQAVNEDILDLLRVYCTENKNSPNLKDLQELINSYLDKMIE